MLKFFTENAGAIQAFAAIMSLLASVVLLVATIVYVMYTKRVADFTGEQARQSALASAAQRRAAELSAVSQYFLHGDTPAQQELRRRIWVDTIARSDASQVASFWHFWGLMVEKDLLPFWVFEGSSGVRVVQYYTRLEAFINEVRENGNPHYAEHFTSLRKRVLDQQALAAAHPPRSNHSYMDSPKQ